MPNHQRGRVMGLAANPFMHMRPPTGGPGQGRGANAYGAPYPQQYQQYDQRQFDNLIGQLVNRGVAVSQATPGHLYVPQQSQAMRTQALSRPSTPPVQPRVQSPGLAPTVPRVHSPGLPPPSPTPATPLLEDPDVPEIDMDPPWPPTGQMRGSLVGSAYDQAIERYLQPGGGQRTNQARPPGR